MPGVCIGKYAVVGASDIVTKDVPEGTVVGGVPAVVIGSYEKVKQKTLEKSQKYNGIQSGDLFVKDLLELSPIEFLIDSEGQKK